MTSVYTMSEIDLSLCNYTKPQKFAGYYESYMSYENSLKGIVLQTPKLILRNSTSTFFEFTISRNKDRHRELYGIISHLEDLAVVQSAQNSSEWFNTTINRDQVATMFRSSLHCPLDIDDPFILRVNKVPGLESEINHTVVALIKIEGIIFGRNSSTLDMKVVRIEVVKTEKLPQENYDHEGPIMNDKSFYNDNVSIAPRRHQTQAPGPSGPPVVMPLVSEGSEGPEGPEGLESTVIESTNAEGAEGAEGPESTIIEGTVAEDIDDIDDYKEDVRIIGGDNTTKSDRPTSPTGTNRPTSPTGTERPSKRESTIDSIKCEIMKAMSNNDFAKISELNALLMK